MIEYLAPHGKAWTPYSGCLHGQAECPISAQCWARGLSRRFNQICGGDFKPRFHPERLDQPRHWRKPRRVAVCFMGDLFGNWDTAIDATGLKYEMSFIQRYVLFHTEQNPQHQFLFLTKRPENLGRWNPWPANAWVGITLTGAETFERQAAMLKALGQVQGAAVRYLSYEPAIKPVAMVLPDWLDWMICGGWSGKRPLSAEGRTGIEDAVLMSDVQHIPRWEKSNLSSVLEAPLHQELP